MGIESIAQTDHFVFDGRSAPAPFAGLGWGKKKPQIFAALRFTSGIIPP
jgi:hypothetical protein